MMTAKVMNVCIKREVCQALIVFWWNRIECLSEMSCTEDTIEEIEARITKVKVYLNTIEFVKDQLKAADKEAE